MYITYVSICVYMSVSVYVYAWACACVCESHKGSLGSSEAEATSSYEPPDMGVVY